MDHHRFNQMVTRLERESEAAPGLYRAKVAALALLGFGILALLLGAVGFGLALIAGVALAIAFSGGAARRCCCCSSWASGRCRRCF